MRLLRSTSRLMREAPYLRREPSNPQPRPRHALLINPFYPKDPVGSFGKHVLTPSQSLTTIAAATPENWTIEWWDENLLKGLPPCEPFPAVVGITVHLTFAKRAFELAASYRSRGAKVILGGLHVTSCPEECAPHADAIVIGDGVAVWPTLLTDVAAGALKPRYDGRLKQSFAIAPVPRREIVPRRDFLTTTSVIATRGCRNRCEFCYLATEGLRAPYESRPVEEVALEIEAAKTPYAVFIDNNLGASRSYLRRLCRALTPLAKIWSAAVTVDIAEDPALVREMADSGCTGVFVGFESIREENLAGTGKRSTSPAEYLRSIEVFHSCGIAVNGSFVLGFDHDGPDCFEKTVRWIESARLACATFHILTPYPGTPLFKRLEGEGRILHRDWERYDTSQVVFQPRRMSAEDLERGYRWCYERLFSQRSIWTRRPERWSETPGYLASAYLYKKMNWLWPLLIRSGWTHTLWRPLLEMARFSHHRRRAKARSSCALSAYSPVPKPLASAYGSSEQSASQGRSA